MEQRGWKENTANPNPYITEFEKSFEGYHLLLSQQVAMIEWYNILCSKFSKQWQIYQNNYENTNKHANCVATA